LAAVENENKNKRRKMIEQCVNNQVCIVDRLREFMEYEARSCSMDPGCVTPEYVYRMWGGTVCLEDIEKALAVLKAE
jgi:hypothetical protein